MMFFEILSDESTPVERKIRVRINREVINSIWVEEIRKAQKEITIPGFRKGTAPANLIENHIGRDKIWDQVREAAASRVIQQLSRDADRAPIVPPDYEFSEDEEKNPASYKPHDLIIDISYFLPPPSPEEIEQDLLQKAGAMDLNHKIRGMQHPPPESSLPPDPRASIPGAGVERNTPATPNIPDPDNDMENML